MIELNGKTKLTNEAEKALAQVAGYNPKRTFDQETLGKMLSKALRTFHEACPEQALELYEVIAEQLLKDPAFSHPDSDRICELAGQGLTEAEIWERLYGNKKDGKQ